MNMSEHVYTLPGISFPLCSSFLPTMLEGQFCYKLKLNLKSEQGKENQLMLVLDSNEDRSVQTSSKTEEDNSALGDMSRWTMNMGNSHRSHMTSSIKIKIGTLSSNEHFGGGVCTMTDVKRMNVKDDFLKMPLNVRKCGVELYEDCRTRKLLEECSCVPSEVPGYEGGEL